MKVALLGATGFVGSALLNEALTRGRSVTAIARDARKLPGRERLVAKSCDLFDTTATAEILRGHDAVISAFNPGWKNPPPLRRLDQGNRVDPRSDWKSGHQPSLVGRRRLWSRSEARRARHRRARLFGLG